jgi:hypothetical protein
VKSTDIVPMRGGEVRDHGYRLSYLDTLTRKQLAKLFKEGSIDAWQLGYATMGKK